MSTLTIKEQIFNSADFGDLNPMPDLKNVSYIHAKYALSDRINNEDRKHIGKGMINSLIPYLSEDGYNRELKPKKYKVAILENEYLKATFIPGLGGRLWSLYDKRLEKELLYENKIIQPCNLALRNAWVAGGVEWNVGIKGHTPLTCSPLFTVQNKNSSGEPVLTMFEYERIRGVAYGINAYLDGDKLYVRSTIENLAEKPTYTYWWSNIAVPEEGVRVLSDSTEMFSCLYESNHYSLDKVKTPDLNAIDISFPQRAEHAGDVFFILDEVERPWIAAIDSEGEGLLQYSTSELKGRKVFFWGKGEGGRNWNRHLTGTDRAYIEIQAGLLRTQMEHVLLPAGESLCFTECYQGISVDNSLLTMDFKAASKMISAIVKSYPDPAAQDIPTRADSDPVIYGSGWGAVETREISRNYIFPRASVGDEEQIWYDLLRGGYLAQQDPDAPPKSYYVSKEALELLLAYSKTPEGDNWHTYLHIGIMKYALNDVKGAELAWLKSTEKLDTPWAFRNLSMLNLNEYSNKEKALCYMRRALSLCTFECRGLLSDGAKVLLECGEYDEWIAKYNTLSENLRQNGRLKFFTTMAHIRKGDLKSARAMLGEDFEMADIKEGELSISAIWGELYGAEKPLPARLNFRMNETKK